MIVLETNKAGNNGKSDFVDTNVSEMWNFFALLLYMGLVKLPKISDYWSRCFLYRNEFVPALMSRNRFQEVLRLIRFSDIEQARNDRLARVKHLVSLLMRNFKSLQTPGEVVVIDESMIPIRGKLMFKQYIPGELSKYGVKVIKLYGVKVFKLCGYTYGMITYGGKVTDNQENESVSNVVVKKLMSDYIEEGRTLVIDNYYTNIDLAHFLLDCKTYTVGKLRQAVKHIPKEVLKPSKMKRRDVISRESNTRSIVTNWKDKKNVRFLTTKHAPLMIETKKKNKKKEQVSKPSAIVFYNQHKQGIDISDQLSGYFSVLRKSIRWFHKVAFEEHILLSRFI